MTRKPTRLERTVAKFYDSYQVKEGRCTCQTCLKPQIRKLLRTELQALRRGILKLKDSELGHDRCLSGYCEARNDILALIERNLQ